VNADAQTSRLQQPVPAEVATAEPGPLGSSEQAEPTLVERLVRDPDGYVGHPTPDIAARVRHLLLAITLGAAIFGAVVGSWRGGRQIAYASLKTPLLLLGTLVVCAPTFVAIARATGLGLAAREVLALSLGAGARFSLVLAGLAPIVWLAQGSTAYHRVVLVIVAVCAVAGFAAAELLFRGLRRAGPGGSLAGIGFVAIFAVVGAQVSWLLRPFVVRPRTMEVPFVRGAVEGDLLDAIVRSTRSANGVYLRERAPLPTDSCEASSCD
jgi:hypothetical protein